MRLACFSTLKILATVKLVSFNTYLRYCFSTLKILATVKRSFSEIGLTKGFSTLKILATVKLIQDGIPNLFVLVPLRF